jgi:hypothetical protein
MSPATLSLGCSVFLAAFVGLIVSTHIVNAVIPLKSLRETKATAPSRACTDLSGRTFEWNWPNIPFGAGGCSDVGRKAVK